MLRVVPPLSDFEKLLAQMRDAQRVNAESAVTRDAEASALRQRWSDALAEFMVIMRGPDAPPPQDVTRRRGEIVCERLSPRLIRKLTSTDERGRRAHQALKDAERLRRRSGYRSVRQPVEFDYVVWHREAVGKGWLVHESHESVMQRERTVESHYYHVLTTGEVLRNGASVPRIDPEWLASFLFRNGLA